MNKKGSTGVWILGIVILIVCFVWGSYNTLVTKETNVDNSWAKVQTAYERRADLIPNLVETVKGYTKFEQVTQTEIARLRTGIRNSQNPEELDKYGNEMNNLISGISINVEAYPDLKASENFLSLQDELAGTENRIKWERDNYNDAVKNYKLSVRKFPSNIVANIFGFDLDKYETFSAREGAEEPVLVDFE